MDDDPALRSLEAQFAQEDPRLAALLSGGSASHRRRGPRSLLVLVVTAVLVTVVLLVPPTVVLGATAMLLALGSPLVACWLCASGDRTSPRPR